jgi:hypothetical protein
VFEYFGGRVAVVVPRERKKDDRGENVISLPQFVGRNRQSCIHFSPAPGLLTYIRMISFRCGGSSTGWR